MEYQLGKTVIDFYAVKILRMNDLAIFEYFFLIIIIMTFCLLKYL